VKMWI